jgi:hypothetical protein
MKRNVLFNLVVLTLAIATTSIAAISVGAPEINPGSAATPVALLGGALMILRSRLRR